MRAPLSGLADFEDAASLVAEADDLAPGAGALSRGAAAVDLLAWQGAEAETRHRAKVILDTASQLGLGSLADSVGCSLTTRSTSASAATAMRVGTRTDSVRARSALLRQQGMPDLVEAASRTGDLDLAQLALSQLGRRVDESGTPWALGILARSRALLANGEAEQHFQSSLDLLARTRQHAQLARTHLLYGEWLRRQKRRLDARSHLRIAHEVFDGIGSEAFAERARVELLATGERARRRSVDQANLLTPQEAHVARLAAQGDTNLEIAAQLYLSTSTVEYHLHKVFRKLDISPARPPGSPSAGPQLTSARCSGSISRCCLSRCRRSPVTASTARAARSALDQVGELPGVPGDPADVTGGGEVTDGAPTGSPSTAARPGRSCGLRRTRRTRLGTCAATGPGVTHAEVQRALCGIQRGRLPGMRSWAKNCGKYAGSM